MNLEAYLTAEFAGADAGGAVLVRQKGTTLIDRGFGLANRATRRLARPATTFQIASISKQFAAAAILRLQEQGVLSVHDRIGQRLPGCPASWQPITLHHLLTHMSGIGHWDALSSVGGSEGVTTTDELVGRIQRSPLQFSPGREWHYSSLGYVLLAQVVALVSSQTYAKFLENSFFRPLGMISTGAGRSAPFSERQAVGYAGGEPVDDFDLDISGMGTGDIWSTTADMARWDAALASGQALSTTSFAAMISPQATMEGEVAGLSAISYGYGQFVSTFSSEYQGKIIFPTGWNPGFRSVNLWSPDADLVVVVLANEEHDIDPLAIGVTIAGELV